MAKQSLVSAAKETAVVPAGFGETAIQVAGPQFVISPYVVFAHPMAKTLYPRILAANPSVETGDPVLILPEPANPIALNPFRFYIVHAWQHFSILDDSGQLVKMTLDVKLARSNSDFKEHIETVLAVFTPNGLWPARCTFKTTKANAAHRALATLRHASGQLGEGQTPWQDQSAEHKATLQMPLPWQRFVNTVRLKSGTSRATGRDYVAATSTATPSTPSDWEALAKMFDDPKKHALCETVQQQYHTRVAEVKAKEV